MISGIATETDIIEEFKLRTWARENYVAADKRDENWHPIVLDEMSRRDLEAVQVTKDQPNRLQPSSDPKALRA